MKRNPIHFLRTLRAIALPIESKERMRVDLSAYAELHTVRERLETPRVSPLSVFMLRSRSLYAGALALVLMVAGGTQASLAAEGAVPGDILYAIKVAIAEPVALTLAATSEQKAELSARFASRRVSEATTLSSEGRLDEKTAEELATRFDTHVDALAKETHALEAKGDIAVSLAVRTDLEQKLAASVEDLSTEAPMAAMAVSAKMAVAEAPADTFAGRVFEKSKTLTTTRDRLDTALALDRKAEEDQIMDLGAIAAGEPSEVSDAVSSVLFFAKQAEPVASTTATTTATTTVEAATTTQSSPASRFFSPFRKR